jgi:predicted small secreted protein
MTPATLDEKDRPMRRKIALVLALAMLVGTAPLLTACYTTAGAGQDLQAAGRSMERSADRNTTYKP